MSSTQSTGPVAAYNNDFAQHEAAERLARRRILKRRLLGLFAVLAVPLFFVSCVACDQAMYFAEELRLDHSPLDAAAWRRVDSYELSSDAETPRRRMLRAARQAVMGRTRKEVEELLGPASSTSASHVSYLVGGSWICGIDSLRMDVVFDDGHVVETKVRCT